MNTGWAPAGSVAALWRYPVKSMQGEELVEALVTARGILGDRAYALRDRATGHIASAKHPRKWGRLLACQASYVEPPRPGAPPPPIWITLPDGAVLHSEQPDVDRVLSRLLERDVELLAEAPATPTREADRSPVGAPDEETINEEPMAVAAPAGTFFDYAPIHILTTATIDRLRELHPRGRFEVRRFRPNLVVATPDGAAGLVENAWPGRILAGNGVRLRLVDPCPRCVVTTLAQGDLPHDRDILRTLARHSTSASATLAPGVVMPAVAGVYAAAMEEGVLRRGGPLWIG